jgi:hypothetical protein
MAPPAASDGRVTSQRKAKYSGSRLHALSPSSPPLQAIDLVGIRIRIPLRDSSGLAPDSMTLS